MLLNFSCANHRSIRDEVNFSMIASKDDTFEEVLKNYDKYRVLNTAVIYGANGSGKTNLLGSLAYMQSLVITSVSNQPGEIINQYPHKLGGFETPSTYNMQFVKNNIRYAYGFSVKCNVIDEEYLYYYPNKKKVKIFERNGLNVEEGNQYKRVFNLVTNDILKENRLLLSCLANFTNLEEIKKAFLFFSEDIVFYDPSVNNWMQYSLSSMIEDEDLKNKFLQVMQNFDTGIEEIKVTVNQVDIEDILKKAKNIPDEVKNILPKGKADSFKAKVVYNNFETDLLSEESVGVKKLFEIICPIIDILENDRILICDELENSLHESIVYEIIKMFSRKTDDRFSQLIFTTHDTSLLSANLFRRDQVWFTELDKESRATDLFSLVELKNVRKTENLESGYISGKYGGIPMLNKNFLQ